MRKCAPRELITKPKIAVKSDGHKSVLIGASSEWTSVRGSASSCIQGSAIGNATSASSSARSWCTPGMFSFRSTRDDRETPFPLQFRDQ